MISSTITSVSRTDAMAVKQTVLWVYEKMKKDKIQIMFFLVTQHVKAPGKTSRTNLCWFI